MTTAIETTKTVGAFTHKDGQVTGPKAYMEAQGSARLRRIESGNDHVFNYGVANGGDIITTVLVSLQTDYAAWQGMQEFNGRRKN